VLSSRFKTGTSGSGAVLIFLPTHNLKVYIALGITDMRKSIDGLSILVSEKFKLDLFSGHLFVFCNLLDKEPHDFLGHINEPVD